MLCRGVQEWSHPWLFQNDRKMVIQWWSEPQIWLGWQIPCWVNFRLSQSFGKAAPGHFPALIRLHRQTLKEKAYNTLFSAVLPRVEGASSTDMGGGGPCCSLFTTRAIREHILMVITLPGSFNFPTHSHKGFLCRKDTGNIYKKSPKCVTDLLCPVLTRLPPGVCFFGFQQFHSDLPGVVIICITSSGFTVHLMPINSLVLP